MKLRLALVTSALLATLPAAFADSCFPTTRVLTANDRFALEAKMDSKLAFQRPSPGTPPQNYWSYTLTEKATGKTQTGNIPQLASHAHPHLFLSGDGAQFAVLDDHAETRYENRVLIFLTNGKLIASLGVTDILNKDELSSVRRSVNHLTWLGFDPTTWDRETRTYDIYSKMNNTITLTTPSMRKVAISLTSGKLVSPIGK